MPSRIIPPEDRSSAIDGFARLVRDFLPGRELKVTVEEHVPERSARQRASLFGVAYKALMAQMGLSGEREKAELHAFLCGEFFGWRQKQVLGETRKLPVRTTTTNENGQRDVISVRQQMEFYEWIQRKAAEFGFDVPDPDPEWFRRAEREAEIEALAAQQRPIPHAIESPSSLSR